MARKWRKVLCISFHARDRGWFRALAVYLFPSVLSTRLRILLAVVPRLLVVAAAAAATVCSIALIFFVAVGVVAINFALLLFPPFLLLLFIVRRDKVASQMGSEKQRGFGRPFGERFRDCPLSSARRWSLRRR